MKYKLSIIVGIAAVMAVKTAQAIPDTLSTGNVENGNSFLASASTPGSMVYVNWAVNLVGTTYTYSYQVYDSSSDPIGVESLNVGFSTTAPGAYVASSATGGNIANIVNAGGITWDFSPVATGNLSGALSFQSLLAPSLGNANALDSNPPSPWASVPGGQQVPVPAVPDGGATVMLLGAALSVMGLFRKKLIAS